MGSTNPLYGPTVTLDRWHEYVLHDESTWTAYRRALESLGGEAVLATEPQLLTTIQIDDVSDAATPSEFQAGSTVLRYLESQIDRFDLRRSRGTVHRIDVVLYRPGQKDSEEIGRFALVVPAEE